MTRQENVNPLEHLVLPLYSLRCSSHALVIEQVLRHQPGVTEVYANPATARVHILYDAALTHPDWLRTVLRHSGFGPKVETQ